MVVCMVMMACGVVQYCAHRLLLILIGDAGFAENVGAARR
jgi:hypothetical protein